MNESRKPRVLVTTVPSWSSRGGSDTMSSLMMDYGAENVASLYIRADKSDSPAASKYFHIFENAVLKSIIHRGVKTGVSFRPEDIEIDESSSEMETEKSVYRKASKYNRSLLMLFREIMWKLGKWKSPEMVSFLDDFNPEVLFCPIEGYIHFNSINEYIIKKYHPRVVGIIWDDNFTFKQEPYNFWHQVHRFWLRRSVKRMIKKCDTVFALSPKMKEEVDKEFCIQSELLTKPIFNKGVFQPYEPQTPIRVLYTGKLIIGRDKTVAEVVDAIREINKDGQKIVLDIYTNTELTPNMEARINVPGCCNLHAPIPQSEVFKKQAEADVLLFAESLSDKSKTARLSFSTKLTDYFSAGKCVWGVGNTDLGPIDYLRTEDAGLVSTDKESILNTLKLISDNKQTISQYAQKAYDCGVNNHNKDKIIMKLYDAITLNGGGNFVVLVMLYNKQRQVAEYACAA